MNRQATASPAQLSAKPIIQQKVSCVSQPSTSGSIAGPSNSSMYKVRVPRNLAKKYSTMRFQSTKVDISSISKAQMTRQSDQVEEKDGENLPSFGAGSEFGRERREEARKKRRGFVTETKDPDSAPWNLKIGGKSGRRFTGRREAGINENSSYYILTQCEDGAFEAVPVDTWFNFTADIKYKTLTVDEAEEEYNRREKIVNYFSVMVKKRLQDNKEEDEGEDKTLDKKSKIASKTSSLIIHDDELDLSMSEEEGNDDDDDNQTRDKNNEGKRGKKDKQNAGQKQKPKKNESDAESDMSSEEDGYMDSKEMDYLSDSSSSSEENAKVVEVSKPKAEDDLNAEETSSEDDDELTQAGHELKDMLAREEGRESFDEEDEDPDQDEVKGTSALFLQGDKKRKKKSGSGSSTSSNSRSSTPTAALDGAANTIAAAVSKLSQERPGTPSKVKKRPANAAKKGTAGEEGSPAAKKPRVSPAPSSVGTGGGSRTSTPTPTGTEDGPQGITEEAVRRYLARKPMTSKDLLQKFKSKRTGLTNDETVKKIAAIVRKLQPEQKTIKGKLYLSLKQTN